MKTIEMLPPPLPKKNNTTRNVVITIVGVLGLLFVVGTLLGDEGTGFKPRQQWSSELDRKLNDPAWRQHMLDEAEIGHYPVGRPAPLHNMPALPRDDVAPGDNVHRLY